MEHPVDPGSAGEDVIAVAELAVDTTWRCRLAHNRRLPNQAAKVATRRPVAALAPVAADEDGNNTAWELLPRAQDCINQLGARRSRSPLGGVQHRRRGQSGRGQAEAAAAATTMNRAATIGSQVRGAPPPAQPRAGAVCYSLDLLVSCTVDLLVLYYRSRAKLRVMRTTCDETHKSSFNNYRRFCLREKYTLVFSFLSNTHTALRARQDVKHVEPLSADTVRTGLPHRGHLPDELVGPSVRYSQMAAPRLVSCICAKTVCVLL